MFTGIIQAVGSLLALAPRAGGASAAISAPQDFLDGQSVRLGDSIACNGVCLTVTSLGSGSFTADMSSETMRVTCFGSYSRGTMLNLEAACTSSTHLGGHIVQGHVDGIGTVRSRADRPDSTDIVVALPGDILRYVALKGSIAVDGVSLTVNGIEGDLMRLTLIPHTMGAAAISNWRPGAMVNLEADVIARYLERLMQFGQKGGAQGGLTMETLIENGF
ncbi:MAG: riboflavin synthase [Succinivibrio sp.]